MRILLVLLLLFSVTACFRPNHPSFQTIYPLQPYSSMVDQLDSNGRFESRQLTDFYLVYGDVSDTLFLRKLLAEFARSHFNEGLIRLPIVYQIKFYAASGRVSNQSVLYLKDETRYAEEDCVAVITYDPQGHHQITMIEDGR